MDKNLIGMRVKDSLRNVYGIIKSINNNIVYVDIHGEINKYPYPSAFSERLILENEQVRVELKKHSDFSRFREFKNEYNVAINDEINYLKKTGGKRYKIFDGKKIEKKNGNYYYSFDTDSELHFLDGTKLKIYIYNNIVTAYVVYCAEFSIAFQTEIYMGDEIDEAEFTAEAWQIQESLADRLNEINPENSPIAYELACDGHYQIEKQKPIEVGQERAITKVFEQPITFIWGPPGTGKTTTLAKISLECIQKRKRVLMISYSNVSVDGALLKIAKMSNYEPGKILRYGYPRDSEILESKYLYSYNYVLNKYPEQQKKENQLRRELKKLNSKKNKSDEDKVSILEINKKLSRYKNTFKENERKSIQEAFFVATTVSKAVMDKAIYCQQFDMVIFDEASMAYIPQVIFAASLAKERFCCLGDFRQLPAIVQNRNSSALTKDIFEYTSITQAVDNNYSHKWLVMLNCQYRMHPEISDIVGEHMYNNMLYSATDMYIKTQPIADLLPLKGTPMCLFDLSDTYSVCIKTDDESRINLMSAMFSIKLAEKFVQQYEVGIITPYTGQSRLVTAMIRDLKDEDENFNFVTCATVHQFQGSEKSIIIYDAVDCFRMTYPGMLLTSLKNDMADKLFNVALTRTKGKFVLIANKDYLFRKHISKNLLFTKVIKKLDKKERKLYGENIFNELGTLDDENPKMFLGERDDVDSWERYLNNITKAQKSIFIDVPGTIDDDLDALEELKEKLESAEKNGVKIFIRNAENVTLPSELEKYAHPFSYVTTPFTLIDKEIVWFGEPLSSADFISENNVIETKYFPCLRFKGKNTAKVVSMMIKIPNF